MHVLIKNPTWPEAVIVVAIIVAVAWVLVTLIGAFAMRRIGR